MDLNIIHGHIRNISKNLTKDEFKFVINYMKYICDQYQLNPDSVYTFLTSQEAKQDKAPEPEPTVINTPSNHTITASTQQSTANVPDNNTSPSNQPPPPPPPPSSILSSSTHSIASSSRESVLQTTQQIEIKIEPECAQEPKSKPISVPQSDQNKRKRYSQLPEPMPVKVLVNNNRKSCPQIRVSPLEYCRVCEKNRKSTYRFGPGVCLACSSFFIRSCPINESFQCEYKNDCYDTDRILECRKCRYIRCVSAGMAYREETIKQESTVPVKSNIQKSSTSLVINCPICDRSESKIGTHYGTIMCSSCAKFYSNRSNSTKNSKCTQNEKSKINTCDKLDVLNCRSCRLRKIEESINQNV